ncbi:MAG: hypothetical protein CM15mP59_6720 [Flavobacteriaceae bacterium]|nr:MAG: hypothetical protein CM15mP59_6720 [Flavobacteriaceae bacterium]
MKTILTIIAVGLSIGLSGQTLFSAQKENGFVWWSKLWMPLA